MAKAAGEHAAVARGLRKKAKRLRYLAKDLGDTPKVKTMSRKFDAQAAAIERGSPPDSKPEKERG